MNVTRKSISLALYNALVASFEWKKTERLPDFPSRIEPADQPYMSLIKMEEGDEEVQRGLTKYVLNYSVFAYMRSDSVLNAAAVSDLLDDIEDAIGAPFNIDTGDRTFGNLVEDSWLAGTTRATDARDQQQLMVLAHIKLVTGDGGI
jgi:hypothetical protein